MGIFSWFTRTPSAPHVFFPATPAPTKSVVLSANAASRETEIGRIREADKQLKVIMKKITEACAKGVSQIEWWPSIHWELGLLRPDVEQELIILGYKVSTHDSNKYQYIRHFVKWSKQ